MGESQKHEKKQQSTFGSSNESGNLTSSNATEKDNVKHEDNHSVSMDDIFHLDSIPGLANILADDSIDPTSIGEHSMFEQNQPQDGLYQQRNSNDYRDGGSKFSQFFQQDTNQMLKRNSGQAPQFHLDGAINLKQDQGYEGG